MANNSNVSSTGGWGNGFFGLLGVAFIVLKLTGYINWSWWIVLSPIWGSILVGLLIFLVMMFVIYRNTK